MKKLTIFIGFLCIMAVTGVFSIQRELLSEKDNVIITEEVVYGDKSKLDNVTFERNVHLKEHVYWNTRYHFAEPSVYDTNYMFYENGYQQGGIPYWQSSRMNFVINTDYEFNPNEAESEMKGLELAYKKLFDETPNSEERYEVVKVKDYLKYYVFDLDFDLNGKWWRISFDEEMSHISQKNLVEKRRKEAQERLKILEAFHAFFKIPVLENQYCQIGVAKTKNGMLDGYSYATYDGATSNGNIGVNIQEQDGMTITNTYYLAETYPQKENEDYFYFDMTNVTKENTCYFTFLPRTDRGAVIDTSQISGGYGIYRFTFDETKEWMDTDSLEMVYPLNSNISSVHLEKDETEEHILLFTEEEGQCYLTVIDIETMETKQKVAYAPDIEEDKTRCYWVYDDFIVAQYLYEKAVVISQDENGMYQVEFTIDVSEEENARKQEAIYMEETLSKQKEELGEQYLQNISSEEIVSLEEEKMEQNTMFLLECISATMTFDWNGTELLLSDSLVDKSYYRDKCGIYLAVFDEVGLQYYGEYTSSLDTGYSIQYYEYSCRPMDADSLIVSWK